MAGEKIGDALQLEGFRGSGLKAWDSLAEIDST